MKLPLNRLPIALFGLVFALALTLAQSFGGAIAAPVASSAFSLAAANPAATNATTDKPAKPVAPLSGLQVSKRSPEVSGITYTILTSTGGVPVSATNGIGLHNYDDAVAAISFPFPVTFYGRQYMTGTVSTNGNLQFNSNSTDYSNTCLPGANFVDAIAVYWDDLDTSGTGQDIYTETLGTAPNRTFIIEWRAETHSDEMPADAELVLYENNSDLIRVYYGNSSNLGASATAGLQEGTGTGGNSYSEYSCDANHGLLFNGLVVTYAPVQGPTPTPGGATPTSTPMATATPAPTATDCPNVFVDLNGNIFYNAIHYLNCAGVVNGTDATHYSPAGTSTRAQFAKVVVLGFGLTPVTPLGPDFNDVPPTYYAYTYIETGYHNAILSGFDQATCQSAGQIYPCYLPGRPITRGQLTKLVVNAAHYIYYTPSGGPDFTDVPAQNVFYTSIETAYHKGVVGGYPDHTFRPNLSIRRDEMAQIVYKAVTTP